MGTSDLITLFFLIAAVVIFFQLRNVLGRRTGNEKPRYEQTPVRSRTDALEPGRGEGKVITLPGVEYFLSAENPVRTSNDKTHVDETGIQDDEGGAEED